MNQTDTPHQKDFCLLGVDHIAIPVRSISYWKKYYLDVLGGKVFFESHDVLPDGPSSMELCGIRVDDYSLALIAGIDREDESQVSAFVRRHGDHGFQHVALAVDNLALCVKWHQNHGCTFLGEIKEREDAFGPIRQIFGARFDKNVKSQETNFYEFVERPGEDGRFKTADSFSADFAKDLFQDVDNASAERFFDATCIFGSVYMKNRNKNS